MNFKKDYKKLYKQYSKKLKKVTKDSLSSFSLDSFILYLKFMRDYYILGMDLKNKMVSNAKAISLTAALSEYDKYLKCIDKYSIFNNKVAKQIKNKKIKKDELLKLYMKERELHWKTFWEIVATNILGWTKHDN